ncbi:hypothetical protein UFOVP639_19 [uncultured Caudovirales phage]|uniref:Uncharacterized protein n=1 Tax=uncultured Caudovirales phage TaxID=2100421 RepID=A0A6J5N959_9CAUD|nr:hypothetical protein UFOVP639_19 [uncultured Caudovirales phage]
MHIKLISETFKGDDGKIEREIIKTLGLDPDRPKAENDKILKEINDMLDTVPPLVNRFEFDGKEWGFMPNLQKITTNEFIDLEQYIKDGKQLHRIASILYRPIVKQNILKDAINTIFFDKELYAIEKYEGTKYADTLKHIDFRIVLGAMFFFSSLGKELSDATNTYIQKETKKKKKIVSKS